MKINILYFETIGRIPNATIKHTLIKNYKDVEQINPSAINRQEYFLINSLEKNQDFINKVIKIRAEMDIPKAGFSYEDWNKAKRTEKYGPAWLTKVETASIQRLPKVAYIPDILMRNLSNIVIRNAVLIPLPKVFVQAPYVMLPTSSLHAVKIIINDFVSKPELINLIKNLYDSDIKPALKKIKNRKNTKLPDLTEGVLELRNKGLTYPEIVKEFKKNNLTVDEASLRKISSKSQKIISSLSQL